MSQSTLIVKIGQVWQDKLGRLRRVLWVENGKAQLDGPRKTWVKVDSMKPPRWHLNLNIMNFF